MALDWNNSQLDSSGPRLFALYYFDARSSRYAQMYIKHLLSMDKTDGPSGTVDTDCMEVSLPFIGNYGQPAGVVNPSGSRVLEYADHTNRLFIEARMKPIREKEEAERDARREAKLDWFRKNDPAEARLIEERMRSQGKVVPPPKE